MLDSGMAKATIIGAGPNGLSAAITMAQAGIETTLLEAGSTPGGAARTAEITLPGFRHDLGSSVYPMGAASPFFNSLPLHRHGHRWVEPPAPLAHPLDDGTAIMLEHDLASTCSGLGNASDAAAYKSLIKPLVNDWPALCTEILGPVVHIPRSPLLLARFGIYAMLPATTLARSAFKGERARALFAGMAAHTVLPLTSPLSSAVGLVLAAAGHTTGWPIAEGGAQTLTDALAEHLESLGGSIHLNRKISALEDIDPTDVILCDISPRQLLTISGDAMPASYRRRLESYRYGPGAYKIDWALSDPIPWTAKDCSRAATVHVGGTLEEMIASEAAPWTSDRDLEKPFVLLVQPSLFDHSRAPAGKHTAWGYCHVRNGSTASYFEAIEAQVERFAPGFRDCILARTITTPSNFEAWNANLIGGDLSGGAMTAKQMLFRPTPSLYCTGLPKVFLCSASTPPGGGVHGMCGHLAAKRAIEKLKLA
ncbi:phytoene desaturase family protein [Granulicella aggregans]|nr:NAD(P)/FAD-dependent oxidoreductase [Granulicella aggregans]